MQEKQTSINRKVQSVSADATQIAQLQKDKQTLEDKLQEHKDIACESPQYYKEMKQKCCEQWKEITTSDSKSNRSSAEDDRLEQLKHCFTLTISADYQMQKLVPYWGSSPQPGSTYYFQKLMITLELLTTGMNHLRFASLTKEWAPKQQTIPYPPLPQISR